MFEERDEEPLRKSKEWKESEADSHQYCADGQKARLETCGLGQPVSKGKELAIVN